MRPPIRWNRSPLLCLVLLSTVLCACATTAGDNSGDPGDDDDDPPGTIDAASGFVDAGDIDFIDAASPGTIDAASPVTIDAALPVPIDAAPPLPPDANTGPFCTADNQCNTSAHECCWKIIPPDFTSGTCTYGNVVPFLGCVPSDPPDAGP